MTTLVVLIQFYTTNCTKYRKYLVTTAQGFISYFRIYIINDGISRMHDTWYCRYIIDESTDVPCVISIISRGNASAAKRKHFVKQIATRLMSRCTEICNLG